MKKFIVLILTSFFLFSCEKEKIVEIETKVEVPTNPINILDKAVIDKGYISKSDYIAIVASLKTFANNQGANSYGYFIYYGPNNFDDNIIHSDGNSFVSFVLCVTDWNVKDVYSLGTVGKYLSSNEIHSKENRPNLVPTNVDFYKNKFCGFITRAELLAL